MLRFRSPDWPRDREGLARLDPSFASDVVYAVERRGPLDFALVERPIDPPLVKRYAVDWDALAASPHVTVADRDGAVVGVAAVTWQAWNRRAELSHLYVDAASRGRGVGTGLLRAAERAARALGARCLWVETQQVNAPAIRFYLRQGYACCGLDAALYDDDREVAVFFVRAL
jgi:ribosomal protein S18 acetylase RimI-like enzyme